MVVGRPPWPDYFLSIAEAVSARGDCRRSRVGAVLVRADNTVCGIGYNGVAPGARGCLAGACPRGLLAYDDLPANTPYDRGAGLCVARHAEWNALANMRPGDRPERCYVTREPCSGCAATLAAHGVKAAIWPGGSIELGETP